MDIVDLISIAREQGWVVTRTRRTGHWKFLSPEQESRPVFTSGTPSDWRTVHNLRAELRRQGLRC